MANAAKTVTIEVWANGVKIKRPSLLPTPPPGTSRGAVNGLSNRSSRRLRWAIENTPTLLAKTTLFVCLTYPSEWPRDGREVKRHLDTFGKRLMRIGMGSCFAWVLEYQTRGAPHFHLLARFPDAWELTAVRRWVRQNWFEVVGSGDPKHFHAGTSVEYVNIPDMAGRYLSNYLGKAYQKKPPQDVRLPGRMWGMIGCKPPPPEVHLFPVESKESVMSIRSIRRWAASDHAARQRTRHISIAERKREAQYLREFDPQLSRLFFDFRNVKLCVEVKPEDRKAWSPRDPGRGRGFSVRNGARVARLVLPAR